jgi:hypothetical protein
MGSGSSPSGGSSLLATGRVRSRDLTGENTLNRLRVVGVKKGEITYVFDGYRIPDVSTQYVIRVEAVAFPGMELPLPTVRVKEFRPEGFAVSITRGESPLTVAELRKLEVMIEVRRL